MTMNLRYSESRFDGARSYEVDEEYVCVEGRDFLQRDFQARIPLADLTPEPHRIKQRSNSFFAGLGLSLVFGFSLVVMVGNLSWSMASLGPMLSFGFCVAGALLMAATWRKVEFAVFVAKSGANALAIARAGPEAAEFDAFIHTVSERITHASGA